MGFQKDPRVGPQGHNHWRLHEAHLLLQTHAQTTSNLSFPLSGSYIHFCLSVTEQDLREPSPIPSASPPL